MIIWPIEIKDNKYTRWYNSIISNAKDRPELNGYKEAHHIVPRAFGGDNSKSNLVELTAREHFICHWLLVKMTGGINRAKMVYALSFMGGKNKFHQRYSTKITARVYEINRIEFSKNHSELFKGRILTDEHRKKISVTRTGSVGHKPSEYNLQRLREANTGRVCSEETRKKISEAQIGKIVSEETRLKQSIAARNKPPISDETRRKLSETGKGRKVSQETIAKRIATRNKNKDSAENRDKYS